MSLFKRGFDAVKEEEKRREEYHTRLHPREPDCNQRSGREDETARTDACRKTCPSQKLLAHRRRAHTGRKASRQHPSGGIWRYHHPRGTCRV